MPNNLVIRSFNDAVFAFNRQNHKTLFIEGTVADIVPNLLKHPDKQITESYMRKIPLSYQAKAKEDVGLTQKTIRDFLSEFNVGEQAVLNSNTSDTNETPMQRLLAYAIKEWQIINASIELNYHCNLQCQCCYTGNNTKKGLQQRELQLIGEQLLKIGTVFILFTGGEIFLRKDALDILNDFNKLGFILEIKSNGILLTNSLISELANLNLFSLQVSVYDIEDRHSVFTREYYQFSRLANNIRMATEQGVPLSIAVLVGKHNVGYLSRYHDTLQKLGAVDISYNPYITPLRDGTGKENVLRLSRKEMDEKFYPFLEKINGFVGIRKYRNRCKNGPVCYAGREQISIDPEGTVFPCLDLRLPIGNLLQDNISSILKKRKKLLKPYTFQKISKCWHCSIAEYCDSCIGTSLLENGNFTKPSQHKCDITHFYFEANLKRKRKEVIK